MTSDEPLTIMLQSFVTPYTNVTLEMYLLKGTRATVENIFELSFHFSKPYPPFSVNSG